MCFHSTTITCTLNWEIAYLNYHYVYFELGNSQSGAWNFGVGNMMCTLRNHIQPLRYRKVVI
mgnify:CR=1 FL=1